jgi:two-component system chemotaxis sensor kinase CheA
VRDRARPEGSVEAHHGADARQTLLLFGVGEDRRMAIPLAVVSRLEEFPRHLVERANGQDVVQYRGEIMPIVRLTGLLGLGEGTGRDPMQVVVYSSAGRSVGLVVDNILDIVDETLSVQRPRSGGAVYGSAVIQQRVTDLLDVEAIVRELLPAEV